MKITNAISPYVHNLSYQITDVKSDRKYKKENTTERHNEDISSILYSPQRWLRQHIDHLNIQKFT